VRRHQNVTENLILLLSYAPVFLLLTWLLIVLSSLVSLDTGTMYQILL